MPSEDHQKKSAASLPIESTREKNFSWINPHWKLWHIKKVSLNGIINRYIYIERERDSAHISWQKNENRISIVLLPTCT